MATDDYSQGISIADLASAPNAETLGKNIANPLAARSIMRFASASARTAALTGAAAPVEGMATWLQDVNRLYVYDGTSWIEMSRALTSEFVDDTTNRTTTSTSYGNSSSALSDTIAGPPSGQIEVTIGVRCDNSGGSNTLTSFNASGSTTGSIYTANDGQAIQWADTQSGGPLVLTQIIACAVGETVTVTLQHRVIAGTGNFRYRYLRLRQV